jgi:protein-S-isoprenylcysteine O-methyltransferase Ste14
VSISKRPILSDLIVVVGISAVIGIFLTAAILSRANQLRWGSLVWLGAFYLMSAVRVPYVIQNVGNVINETRSDWTDRALLAGMAVSGVVLPFIALATPWLRFADYALPDWATMIGAMLVGPALWLLWRSHADLGANWSPGLELRRDHGLITRGVYRYIRHPMYAGLWLWCLAQPLLVHNWLGGAAVVPAFALLYLIRTPREEEMMRDRFGAIYDAYSARTGRLVPMLPGGFAT